MPELSASTQFEYVGFWQRAAVLALDAVISLPLIPAHFWALQQSLRLRSAWPLALMCIAAGLYIPLCVWRFGGSPAKLLLRMRVVDASGAYLGFGRALLRSLLEWIDTLIYLFTVLQVLAALPPDYLPSSIWNAAETYAEFGGFWSQIHANWFYVWIADVCVVTTNPCKRAFHDFIAGSFVITKRSYDAAHPPHPASVTPPALQQ
ncbi:MAG: RDD family protein [Acidobacteria bacterium]|nr:RDD family protein [Acidobacteriota bacterium]